MLKRNATAFGQGSYPEDRYRYRVLLDNLHAMQVEQIFNDNIGATDAEGHPMWCNIGAIDAMWANKHYCLIERDLALYRYDGQWQLLQLFGKPKFD